MSTMLSSGGSNPGRQNRWLVVSGSFLVMFLSQGMTLGGLQVFDAELLSHLSEIAGEQVSLGAFKAGLSITFATTALLGVPAGWLCDRIGPKRLLLTGMVLLGVGYFRYGSVQTLGDVYFISILLGVVLVLSGLIINVYLVSSWFTLQRGLAIGIVLGGSSLGNVILPKFNTWLLSTGTWQEVTGQIAWIPIIAMPLLFFVLRDSRLTATNDTSSAGDAAQLPKLSGFRLGEALRSRNFWMLSLLAMCTFYSILGLSGHTFLMFRGQGYSDASAASAISLIFLGGLVGQLLTGILAEKVGRKKVLIVALMLMLSGVLQMLLAMKSGSSTLLWTGVAVFGFSWGGIYTLIQLLGADLFGMLALGKILGVINVLDTIGGASGPVITGILVDKTHSYVVPLAAICAMLLVATFAALMLDMSKGAYREFDPKAS